MVSVSVAYPAPPLLSAIPPSSVAAAAAAGCGKPPPAPRRISFQPVVSSLDACECPALAPQLHARAAKLGGGGGDEFMVTRMLAMYSRCGRLQDVLQLFEGMLERSVYAWVAVIKAFVDRGLFDEGLLLFCELVREEVALKFFVFPVVLKACGALGAVDIGMAVHGFAVKSGFLSSIYVANAVIDMYGKCGLVGEAMWVFEMMKEKDCISWNSVITACAINGMVYESLEFLQRMIDSTDTRPDIVSWSAVIAGFAQNGYDEKALELLAQMVQYGVEPNAQTLSSILPSCGSLKALDVGKQLHGYAMRRFFGHNVHVVNALIDVYWRCGNVAYAEALFSKFSVRNLVTYNTMISGYCNDGNIDMARTLFDLMASDGVTRDAASWNLTIAGLVNNGMFDEALKMFRRMLLEDEDEVDTYILGTALAACSSSGAMRSGSQLHSYAVRTGLNSDPHVSSALVDMYCCFRDFEAAELVFRNRSKKCTVCWNVLITGYAQVGNMSRSLELFAMMRDSGISPTIYTWNGIIAGCMEHGENELALRLLSDMQSEDVEPDVHTLGMILTICSRAMCFELAKQVHGYLIRRSYDSHVHLGAGLVDMYSKCGSIQSGIRAFRRIREHNLVSYNTMLAGYALHGHRLDGLSLFDRMLSDGIQPDEITFLSVLTLCVHGGGLEEGQFYFDLMLRSSVKPDLKHYTCMVDLLSRAGRLEEAHSLIKGMPVQPDSVIWGALLSGCVNYRSLALGEIAARRVIELEGGEISSYVLLANLYAATGRRYGLKAARRAIRDKGMRKIPGCSWVEVGGRTHAFLAGDKIHARAGEIYDLLGVLNLHMRNIGGVGLDDCGVVSCEQVKLY